MSDAIAPSWRRRALHALLNGLRVIDNRDDFAADLRVAPESRFTDCHIEIIGCMALFSATFKENT